jgi:hypothetical protein
MRRQSSRPWGRIVALAGAGLGFVVGGSLATQGTSSPFAKMFFSPEDAARWYIVLPTGYLVAIISGIVGAVLILWLVFTISDGRAVIPPQPAPKGPGLDADGHPLPNHRCGRCEQPLSVWSAAGRCPHCDATFADFPPQPAEAAQA